MSLVLDSVEQVNHNTKKFRFHLPEEDSVSGLNVACRLVQPIVALEMVLMMVYSCFDHQVQGS